MMDMHKTTEWVANCRSRSS